MTTEIKKGRVKTCFTSGEIAHKYIHQAAPTGRVSGGHERFDGVNYYDYDTQIGKLVTVNKGQHKGKLVLFLNDRSFSNTTSGVQSGLRRAANHIQVFSGDFGGYDCRFDLLPEGVRDVYLAEYRQPVTPSKYEFKRASNFLDQIAWLERAIAVCEYFALPVAALKKELSKQRH